MASRGLDLAAVSWVVQYHMTGGPVDYVHRVGRTARAGGRGKALVYLDQDELGFMDLLKSKVGIEFEMLSLPDLLQTVLFHLRHCGRARTNTVSLKFLYEDFIQMLDMNRNF